jgi:hypothetical protein
MRSRHIRNDLSLNECIGDLALIQITTDKNVVSEDHRSECAQVVFNGRFARSLQMKKLDRAPIEMR